MYETTAEPQFAFLAATSPELGQPPEIHAVPYGYITHVLLREGPELNSKDQGLLFSADGRPQQVLRIISDAGSWHSLPYAYIEPTVSLIDGELVLRTAGWTTKVRGTRLHQLLRALASRAAASVARHITPDEQSQHTQITSVSCEREEPLENVSELHVWAGNCELRVDGTNLEPLFTALSDHSLGSLAPDLVLPAKSKTHISQVTLSTLQMVA